MEITPVPRMVIAVLRVKVAYLGLRTSMLVVSIFVYVFGKWSGLRFS